MLSHTLSTEHTTASYLSPAAPVTRLSKFHSFLRNAFGSALAIALIACGRVRRAKKRALNSGVVTAIFFHNPNKRIFAQCVTWLTNNGYTFISDTELSAILHGDRKVPKGAVWLSFDDGFKELLHNVIPLSCERQFPITVFIPSGIVDGPGRFPWLHKTTKANAASTSHAFVEEDMRDSLTAGDVIDISRFPLVSIGSHTVWHTVTANLSDDQLRFELAESRRELESLTGRTVDTFAYPEGRLNGREVRWLTECGYRLAATTEAAFITEQSNAYFVPRFCVGDNIWLPEAICNMVGVWRPVIGPLQHFLRLCRAAIHRMRYASSRQHRTHTGVSA